MVKSTLKRTKVRQNVFFLAEARTFVHFVPLVVHFVPLEASMRGSAEESTPECGEALLPGATDP